MYSLIIQILSIFIENIYFYPNKNIRVKYIKINDFYI